MNSALLSLTVAEPVKALPALPKNNAEVFHLDNGLTLIVEERPSSEVASIQAWCATGSIHEDKWLGAGMSHILEHMLFKGTEKRGAGEIAKSIQDKGGYINAYTSFDRTVYWIDIPTAGIDTAVDILADAMQHSTLPVDEYAKEQEVIRREFAMGEDDPNRQSIQLLLETMYSESPYGYPVIGYIDVFNKLTREDVMAYYKARYVPNNLTFVVVGNVKADEIKARVEKLFEGSNRQALQPVYVPEEQPQVGRREAEKEFPTELSRLYIAWRTPGLADPDFAALQVLSTVAGGGRSSLLNQTIREKDKLAHAIYAAVFSMQTQSVFFVSAVCDPSKRAEVEQATMKVIDDIKKQGVSAAEVEKAKRTLLADSLTDLATARGRASSLGSNWALTRNLDLDREFLQRVSAVTPEEVQRVAVKYLAPETVTVTALNPMGSFAQEHQATKPVEQRQVQKFVLPNGLRLLVMEDSSLPLVSLVTGFRGGLLVEDAKNNGITRLLAQTMLKGTKNRSAEQIALDIESVGGQITADSGNNSFSVGVDVMAPDLDRGFELLADVLLNPTFPEDQVAIEKNAQLANIKAEDDQITTVARNVLRQNLFGEHPYSLRNNGTPESVGSLTQQQLRTFHDELVTAKNGVLAVFGDVKADQVKKLAEQYFGKLPDGKLLLAEPPQPLPLKKPIDVSEARDKQQAVIMIGYQGVSATSKDRPALELIEEASSDLGSRFFDRIREQMGLAYFVGASQMIGLAPGPFVFYVGTDPSKSQEVKKALADEISTLATQGMSEEELARAKQKLLGAEAIRNQSNASFAASCAMDELMGLGYQRYLERKNEIEQVNLATIKATAQKYFASQSPVEVTVAPKAKE